MSLSTSRNATLTEMVSRTVSEILKGVGTSIPAHILSFDGNTQLAKVQIGVEFIDVQGQTFDLAPIVNVPVHFSGGDFTLEHQIDSGNEGLLIISQRCIDGWKEQGGVAPQTVLRKLDMQDALFVPGFRSKPGAISGFNNNGIMLRNKAGNHYVWLKNTGDILSQNSMCTFLLSAGGSIKGNNAVGSFELQPGGDFIVNGVIISSTGVVTIPSSLILNTRELSNHTHSQGNDSSGDTQVNTSGNN